MIPRYSRPEMAAIWSPETRFRIWFEIEAHAADAMAELGKIPKEAAKKIWDKGKAATFDVARIDAIEAEVKHDVIAFLTHLSEIVGPEARFVHQGMTSSDVLDTCFNVQLVRAADILIADADKLLAALKKRAQEHKMTPIIGRSHGIHAEPTTFGVKLAYAYAEFSRARERLVAARKEVATCAISGAVGTFAQVDPRVEAHVAKAMGLAVEPVSTQIIPRDRHAMYFATLGVVASSIERLAIEIRHLQRTEVLEAEEYFSPGQKGSSAMPHKRNPVLTENVTGLARLVRGYAIPAMENVALWHERDISHSSVERMIGPDSTVTLDFALNRMAGVIDKLVVYPENMQKNLDRLGGLVHSQRVLIALTQKGVAREDAYRIVQESAMKVWRGEGDFLTFLKADPRVTAKMSAKRDRGEFRSRPSLQARRYDFQARVRLTRSRRRKKSPARSAGLFLHSVASYCFGFTRCRIFSRTPTSLCARRMIELNSSSESPCSVTALDIASLASLTMRFCSSPRRAAQFLLVAPPHIGHPLQRARGRIEFLVGDRGCVGRLRGRRLAFAQSRVATSGTDRRKQAPRAGQDRAGEQ